MAPDLIDKVKETLGALKSGDDKKEETTEAVAENSAE